MEKYKEIERSIIKTYRKEIWSKFIKAVKNYQLIQENDKIMVCISGGKDSFLMAKCIQELQRYGRVPFEAHYVVMDPGYNSYNRDFIEDNADSIQAVSSSSQCKEIIEVCEQLSAHNQRKVLTYSKNLLSTQQMEDDLLPNAAHEMNPTEEQKKHADDVMKDDKEWI